MDIAKKSVFSNKNLLHIALRREGKVWLLLHQFRTKSSLFRCIRYSGPHFKIEVYRQDCPVVHILGAKMFSTIIFTTKMFNFTKASKILKKFRFGKLKMFKRFFCLFTGLIPFFASSLSRRTLKVKISAAWSMFHTWTLLTLQDQSEPRKPGPQASALEKASTLTNRSWSLDRWWLSTF